MEEIFARALELTGKDLFAGDNDAFVNGLYLNAEGTGCCCPICFIRIEFANADQTQVLFRRDIKANKYGQVEFDLTFTTGIPFGQGIGLSVTFFSETPYGPQPTCGCGTLNITGIQLVNP